MVKDPTGVECPMRDRTFSIACIGLGAGQNRSGWSIRCALRFS